MSGADEAARLAAFRRPPPLTIGEALASANPIGAIWTRLGRVPVHVPLTAQERLFKQVAGFHADVGNGGLHQALTNSSGDDAGVVAAFVRDWCRLELAGVFEDLARLFADGVIPTDRDVREPLVWAMPRDPGLDPFDDLDARYHALTFGAESDAMDVGLVAFVTRHQDAFVHLATC